MVQVITLAVVVLSAILETDIHAATMTSARRAQPPVLCTVPVSIFLEITPVDACQDLLVVDIRAVAVCLVQLCR